MTKLFTVSGKKDVDISEEDSLNPFTNIQVEETNSEEVQEQSGPNITLGEEKPNNNFASDEIDQPNFSDVQTTIVDNEKKEEYTWVDNSGKTGEDIKNPVYNKTMDDSEKDVSANFFVCLIVFIKAIIQPGSSVIQNTEKYVEAKKALKVSFSVMLYLVIFSCIGRIISGCFVERFVPAKREYGYVLELGNIGNLDLLNVILWGVVFTVLLIVILAAVNYVSSFVRNKSLSFDEYLLVNTLSIIPFILGFNALLPILCVLSKNIAIFVFILSFIYSLIIYLNAIDYLMEFSTYNRKVFYLLINYAVVLLVFLILIAFFFDGDLNNVIELIM